MSSAINDLIYVEYTRQPRTLGKKFKMTTSWNKCEGKITEALQTRHSIAACSGATADTTTIERYAV